MLELAHEFLPCHRALRCRDTRLIAADAASTTATTTDLFVFWVPLVRPPFCSNHFIYRDVCVYIYKRPRERERATRSGRLHHQQQQRKKKEKEKKKEKVQSSGPLILEGYACEIA